MAEDGGRAAGRRRDGVCFTDLVWSCQLPVPADWGAGGPAPYSRRQCSPWASHHYPGRPRESRRLLRGMRLRKVRSA